jgi:hypothetical protein
MHEVLVYPPIAKGFRRKLGKTEVNRDHATPKNRELQSSAVLVPMLKITQQIFFIYRDNVSFTAENANRDVVLQTNIPNGYTVCKSTNVNFEASRKNIC